MTTEALCVEVRKNRVALELNEKMEKIRLEIEHSPFESAKKLAELAAEMGSIAESRFQGPIDLADLIEEAADHNWLCKGLDLKPSMPSLIYGRRASFKSFVASHIALCVASGTPVFGSHQVRQGKALLLDYERGRNESGFKLRDLAGGMGLPWTAINRSVSVYPFPKTKVTAKAYSYLARLTEGKALCVVDSLRRATLGEFDENSTDICESLDVMARVSNETGCTFLTLHHAGKQGTMRGSTALEDAAYSIFVSSKEKDGQKFTFKQEKPGVQGALGPYNLRLDVRSSSLAERVGMTDFNIVEAANVSLKPGSYGLPITMSAAILPVPLQVEVAAAMAENPNVGRNELARRLHRSKDSISAAMQQVRDVEQIPGSSLVTFHPPAIPVSQQPSPQPVSVNPPGMAPQGGPVQPLPFQPASQIPVPLASQPAFPQPVPMSPVIPAAPPLYFPHVPTSQAAPASPPESTPEVQVNPAITKGY